MSIERHWMPKGSQHHAAKLTEEDAKLILELLAEKKRILDRRKELEAESRKLWKEAKQLTISKIAEKFGVRDATISDISERKTWTHV